VWTYIVIAALTVSFVALVWTRPGGGVLELAHLVMLVLVLYATPAVIETAPRISSTWRHVGIADYITRTGSVDVNIDAYFNWPGFFMLLGFVTKAAGLGTAITLAKWATVALNLAYIAPLYVILRSGTDDARAVWLGLWIFFCADWVGQDYLSPQGLAYFIYLVVVALLVRYFVRFDATSSATALLGRAHDRLDRMRALLANLTLPVRRRGFREEEPPALSKPLKLLIGSPAAQVPAPPAETVAPLAAPPASFVVADEPFAWDRGSPAQRAAVMAVMIALAAITVPMHQLTPFAILLVVAALASLGLSSARRLPVILVVLISAWVVFMASAYISGHFHNVTGEVGNVSGTLGSNLGARIGGSPGHVTVVVLRLVFTALIWLLAGIGAFLERRRPASGVFASLALAPFALIALQSYGGEILLRIFLFTLPAMALFAAVVVVRAFSRTPAPAPAPAVAAIAGTLLALTAGFLVARYGNERLDAFTRDQVRAVDTVYANAKPSSVILAGSEDLPWDFKDYETYSLDKVIDLPAWKDADGSRRSVDRLLAAITAKMRASRGSGAFLILTSSEVGQTDLVGSAPRGTLTRLWQRVESSGRFRAIYSSPTADVFVLRRARVAA
jgi:hypothetical protein